MRANFLFGFVVLVCSANASAQSSDPNKAQRYTYSESGTYVRTDDARKIMRDVARCSAKSGYDAARELVLVPVGTQIPEDHLRKATNPQCMGVLNGLLSMSQLQYRGALAETLIGKDFPGLPLFDTTAIPPLDWKTPAPAMIDAKTGRRAKDALSIERNYRGLLAQNYVGQLGECILRSTPRGSVDVLKTTDVASETEAWTAITPQIAGCIPNAQKVTFTRADLRSALAVSYYRLASSAKQQQAAR